MLLASAFGIYFALLGVVAYDDLSVKDTSEKNFQGKSAFSLSA